MLYLLVSLSLAAPLDPAGFTSLGSLNATSDVLIDSDALTLDAGPVFVGVDSGGIAVFVFDDVVTSGVGVTVVGSRPVALLSKSDMALLSTTVDAAAVGSLPGPGGFGGSALTGLGPGGGFEGLSGGGGAGHGGAGGDGTGGLGGPAHGDAAVLLQGGSSGGGDTMMLSGAGGGAIELGAAGDLLVDALSSIDVSGGVGPGLSGGGAGGMILLHASTSQVFGTLIASGGGATGGGGGGGGHVCQSVPSSSAVVEVAPGAGFNPGAAGVECVGDGDGDGVPFHLDCDDSDAAVYPGATEIPGDGIDQSCNGLDADFGAADLAPGDLVISEIMPNPSYVADDLGEWFEIHNRLAGSVDLEGLDVYDLGADGFSITSSLVVPAGDFVVLGINGDLATNGGVTLDYVYAHADLILANGDDEVVLDYQGTVIDQVLYDDGQGWTVWIGTSMKLDERYLDATDNDDNTFWCTSATPFGTLPLADLGTPGQMNGTCELDLDGDGAGETTDCDDEDPTLNLDDLDGDFWSTCDGDCDDLNSALSPTDADQDGFTLCDLDCDDNDPMAFPGDFDGDGWSACDGDCDDFNETVNPDQVEIPDNGLDDDCVDGDEITYTAGTGTGTGGTSTPTGSPGTGTGTGTGGAPVTEDKGCACSNSGSAPMGLLALIPLLVSRRR